MIMAMCVYSRARSPVPPTMDEVLVYNLNKVYEQFSILSDREASQVTRRKMIIIKHTHSQYSLTGLRTTFGGRQS